MRLPDPPPGRIDWWHVGRTLAARGLTRHPREILDWSLAEVALGLQAVEDDGHSLPAGDVALSDDELAGLVRRARAMTAAERLKAARLSRDA